MVTCIDMLACVVILLLRQRNFCTEEEIAMEEANRSEETPTKATKSRKRKPSAKAAKKETPTPQAKITAKEMKDLLKTKELPTSGNLERVAW